MCRHFVTLRVIEYMWACTGVFACICMSDGSAVCVCVCVCVCVQVCVLLCEGCEPPVCNNVREVQHVTRLTVAGGLVGVKQEKLHIPFFFFLFFFCVCVCVYVCVPIHLCESASVCLFERVFVSSSHRVGCVILRASCCIHLPEN